MTRKINYIYLYFNLNSVEIHVKDPKNVFLKMEINMPETFESVPQL